MSNVTCQRSKVLQGFTLIETMLYIALLTLVVGGFVSFALTISNTRNKNYVMQEVHANTRVALQQMSHAIKEATGVNTGSSTFDSDPGVLSVSVADAGNNPTVIDLSADDGQLQITYGAGSPVLVTSDEVSVTNLVFTDLTGSGTVPVIRIEMTIAFNNQSGDSDYTYEQSITTTVSLRQ